VNRPRRNPTGPAQLNALRSRRRGTTQVPIAEIRIPVEQKNLPSVETEFSRLKCLRNSARRDDWVQLGTRFPRLTAPKPLLRLAEILSFLNNLPTP